MILPLPVVSVEGNSLVIPSASRVHIGTYYCIASNGVPPTKSKTIRLRVQCECVQKSKGETLVYYKILKNGSKKGVKTEICYNFTARRQEKGTSLKRETALSSSFYNEKSARVRQICFPRRIRRGFPLFFCLWRGPALNGTYKHKSWGNEITWSISANESAWTDLRQLSRPKRWCSSESLTFFLASRSNGLGAESAGARTCGWQHLPCLQH